MEATKQHSHFVLVHGACHGAWCWYKIKPRLESAGHRVTVFDLAGSGTDRRMIQEVHSLPDYSEPLLDFMASVPPDEKVILVGHSLGGMNLAVAMEKFPEKISAGVYLAAFMPDTTHRPSYVFEEFLKRATDGYWLDTEFSPYGNSEDPLTSMFFGPKFLRLNLYQHCTDEDYALATILTRPGSLFVEYLSKAPYFSIEGYGSVRRVYVVCDEDMGISQEFQRWMINNAGVEDVMEIKGSDHMPMFCMPKELCNCLLEIAAKKQN